MEHDELHCNYYKGAIIKGQRLLHATVLPKSYLC